MLTRKTVRLLCLVAVLPLCVPSLAGVQSADWKKFNDAGQKAYERGDYAEAETSFGAAVSEADKVSGQDTVLAATLGKLAFSLVAQGKSGEAEPVLRRLLGIQQRVLRGEHPDNH